MSKPFLHDVRWLGFDWQDRLTHASDYFQKLYDFAEDLIQQGKAYVDDPIAGEHSGTARNSNGTRNSEPFSRSLLLQKIWNYFVG